MTRPKPMLIGQAPGDPRTDPPGGRPLARCAIRLAELADESVDAFLDRFDAFNLLPDWPGRAGSGGDRFPMGPARERARRTPLPPLSILLGRNVLAAFCRTSALLREDALPPCQWFNFAQTRHGPTIVAWVPHPSGLNRWWNDPANVEQASEFLRRAVRQIDENARVRSV